jgi:Flp pilus assembly pilin Flp
MIRRPRLVRDARGVAAVEFAVMLPLLVLVLLGVLDLGQASEQTIRLEAAARAGAQYGLYFPEDGAGITQRVRDALPSGWTDITVAPPAMVCECPASGTIACANAASCAEPVRRFLPITVTRPFEARLLTRITQLTGDVTLRLQ